jgi:hypothetical protein
VTDLSDVSAAVLDLIDRYGVSSTYTAVTATYASGATTETTTAYTVDIYVTEATTLEAAGTSQGVIGQAHIAASGFAATPKPGDRITYQTRTLLVLGVTPSTQLGTVVGWSLDIAEQGSA